MSHDRFEALQRLFSDARQQPPDARAAFVESAWAPDEDVRTEVLALLDADATAGEFMEHPALDRLARAMAQEGWTLHSGEAIGPYTVLELLGAGAAGEVWRARDDRLRRDVAIKVLWPHIATQAVRLHRFAVEARAASALNHPNILTIHDIGEHQGVPYLVSEYLEGRTLRERLHAGQLPVQEALAVTRGIAEGLAAAHARGIVHRDLKPENTVLRRDGGVKIVDFGLATLHQSVDDASDGIPPTISGVVAGTAGYMAPEQVRGETVDARADLFALGVMLYEMLTGANPFRRDSAFDTLQAVLTAEPPDPSSTVPDVPPRVGAVVKRLLQKSPAGRFHSASDLIWVLDQMSAEESTLPRPGHSTPRPRWRAPSTAAVVAIVGPLLAVGVWWLLPRRSPDPAPEVTRFTWPLPQGLSLGSVPVVSQDSRYMAFSGFSGEDPFAGRLYVRARGSEGAVVPVPGSETAEHPFWSPDSESLGFFARGRLMKVARQGGAPVPLASRTIRPFGGAWSRTGAIVFAPDVILSGLRRVSAEGATTDATHLDTTQGDTSHAWPVALPDGVHFLYFVRSARPERRGIYIGRLDGPAGRTDSMLLRTDSNAVYVPLPGEASDMLLYVVDGRVEARRFDRNTQTLHEDAYVIPGVAAAGTTLTQPAMLSASADMLVFATSTVPYGNRLDAVDRAGRTVHSWETPEAQNWPRLSPDGQRLARQRVNPLSNEPDIWVDDLAQKTQVRVTTALEPDIRPVWSADGRLLAYVSGNTPWGHGRRLLSIARADGSGVVRTFPCPGEYCEPTDWTGRGLLVNVHDGERRDVWIVPTDGNHPAEPLLQEAFLERDARMAPGRSWIAYVSDDAGRIEVSVRSIGGVPRRAVVSSGGGDHPVWRSDGSELFYVDLSGQLWAVPVRWRNDRPELGPRTRLDVPRIGRGHWGTPYDVSPDGRTIYSLRRHDAPAPREIHVVLGWRALIDPDRPRTTGRQ